VSKHTMTKKKDNTMNTSHLDGLPFDEFSNCHRDAIRAAAFAEAAATFAKEAAAFAARWADIADAIKADADHYANISKSAGILQEFEGVK